MDVRTCRVQDLCLWHWHWQWPQFAGHEKMAVSGTRRLKLGWMTEQIASLHGSRHGPPPWFAERLTLIEKEKEPKLGSGLGAMTLVSMLLALLCPWAPTADEAMTIATGGASDMTKCCLVTGSYVTGLSELRNVYIHVYIMRMNLAYLLHERKAYNPLFV
jgi:hypothetical protein